MMRLIASVLTLLLAAALCPAPSAAGDFTHILVPPFRNATGEERIDWIGEAFSRTLTEKFNRIVDLSATHFRARQAMTADGSIDLSSLLDSPGAPAADAALFGAVIKGGDVDSLGSPLEITVRLVDLRTTEQIASLEMTGLMRQIFSMEADLAAKIAGLLGIVLTPGEEMALRTQETRSLLAYKETILGSVFLEDGKYDSAIDMFEQAMEHHPGIFYPKAHNLLAQAYRLSGRREEMLARFRKDAAAISGVYFNLAVAQEFDGQAGEAEKNYGLFLKYTDHRTLNWRLLEPGLAVSAAGKKGVILEGDGDEKRTLHWETGRESGPGSLPAETGEPGEALLALIPAAERSRLTAGPVAAGDRFYYGLDNGYLIGRASAGGERTWAYRLRGVPAGRIVASGGNLAVADDRGNIYSLGLHEGPEPSDLAAYLKLAELALRRNEVESAGEIYRHIVENVKFNVPPAWYALWEIAEGRDDAVAAANLWKNYQEARY